MNVEFGTVVLRWSPQLVQWFSKSAYTEPLLLIEPHSAAQNVKQVTQQEGHSSSRSTVPLAPAPRRPVAFETLCGILGTPGWVQTSEHQGAYCLREEDQFFPEEASSLRASGRRVVKVEPDFKQLRSGLSPFWSVLPHSDVTR